MEKNNSIEDLKKFIINCERKNQTAQKESIESWQTLYSQITDELYSTNKPTLARLKVLLLQTNDFLVAVRDVMEDLRKPGNVISKDFLKTEKKYIDKFESLQTVIQQKIEIRNQQEPVPVNWQHPIFKTPESWKLFKDFLAEKNEHYHTDCSFIYRMMHDREKPPLIQEHIKPGIFRDWLNDTNPENEPLTEKLKTWDKMGTNNREKTYHRLKKEIFKKM